MISAVDASIERPELAAPVVLVLSHLHSLNHQQTNIFDRGDMLKYFSMYSSDWSIFFSKTQHLIST